MAEEARKHGKIKTRNTGAETLKNWEARRGIPQPT
jgi:hypothetical protein